MPDFLLREAHLEFGPPLQQLVKVVVVVLPVRDERVAEEVPALALLLPHQAVEGY